MTAHFCRLPYLAGKDMGRAYVVGPDAKIRADTGHRPGVAWADLDLDEGFEYWTARAELPTLKEAFLGRRRPETYGVLVEPAAALSRWRIREPLLSRTLREMIAKREAARASARRQSASG